MLEVGNLKSFEEDRSHFGAWAITSSPLILGHDPLNKTVVDRIWPIITNKVAISINQAWAGHPGLLAHLIKNDNQKCHNKTQIWLKPLAVESKKFAIFVLNEDEPECHTEAKVPLSTLGVPDTVDWICYDVWHQKKADCITETNLQIMVRGRDSSFYVLHTSDSPALVSVEIE